MGMLEMIMKIVATLLLVVGWIHILLDMLGIWTPKDNTKAFIFRMCCFIPSAILFVIILVLVFSGVF